MLPRVSARTLPVVNRLAEQAPMTTACCNACRTCVSSNLLGLALAGGGAILSALSTLRRRASAGAGSGRCR
jgi:hypothetical protein